ncbi:MAG TPA: hypothetical protein VFW46_13375 [Stellaceae bacterium]|nr:hypothetical protein [Stellaceae bacterium]
MATLPDAELAVIDEWKITRYLLNTSHPFGGPKAAFFLRLGYDLNSWTAFRDALLAHASSAEVISIRQIEFGVKYTLEGPIMTLSGRRPKIRSVWIVPTAENAPRLVTAYPLSAR